MKDQENLETLDYKVSAVIPTKNAGPEFGLLLEKLKNQKGVRELEIIIVDSGSTDGTVETARRYDCRVIEIPPEAFTHSYARNLGAEAAAGDFLLFMVQDALPAGDDWLYKLLKFLIDNKDKKMAAVSCMEFPRSDSDLFYNFVLNNFYGFLQCLEQDRIMEFRGDDYLALRTNGIINNIAGLLRRDLVVKYKFYHNYAEDLDLGVRLIKDGYRLGILSSCRVIHSHNRRPFYFLKRTFVDSVFMADNFPDFEYHKISEPAPLFSVLDVLFGITENISRQLSAVNDDPLPIGELFASVAANIKLRNAAADHIRIEDQELLVFLDFLHRHKKGFMDDEAVINTMLGSLSRIKAYMEYVYPSLDKPLLEEFDHLLWKLTAHTAGLYLGYLFKTCKDKGEHKDIMRELERRLKAGV